VEIYITNGYISINFFQKKICLISKLVPRVFKLKNLIFNVVQIFEFSLLYLNDIFYHHNIKGETIYIRRLNLPIWKCKLKLNLFSF